MVKLHFHGMLGARASVGPAPYFRFSGPRIHAGPESELVCELSGQNWCLHENEFAHFESSAPVMLHFEDHDGSVTEPVGPIARFQGASGVTYANEILFAHLIRRTRKWCDFSTAQTWPHMVVTCVCS